VTNKRRAGFAGAIATVAILALQALEHWSLIDSVVTKLRSMGAAGAFLVNIFLSPLLPLALAITALILVWDGRKSEMEREPVPPPSINNNSTLTANPHFEQHLHFGVGEQKPANIQLGKAQPPRVSFVRGRRAMLHQSPLGVWEELTGHTSQNAILAEFRNIPGKEGQAGATANSVSANLVFRAREEVEQLHINHGTWLSHYEHFVSFYPGDTYQLIIIVNPRGADVTLENPNASNPFPSRFRLPMPIHPREQLIPAPKGDIEIALVDSHNVTVFHGLFDYVTPSEGTSFELRLRSSEG
jgi:hypothetical protein